MVEPVVVAQGWLGAECFWITWWWASSASNPLRALRPARPPAERVVNTVPLSDSTLVGAPCWLIATRTVATTAGPVTGERGAGQQVAGVVVEEVQDLHIRAGGQPVVGGVGLPHLVG